MDPRDFFVNMFNDSDLNDQMKLLEMLKNAGILDSVFTNANDIPNQIESMSGNSTPNIDILPNEKTDIDQVTDEQVTQVTEEPIQETQMEQVTEAQMEVTEEPIEQEQEDKSRCYVCNKRLGIYGMTCKCGKVTCMAHRHPDHKCSFDWKKRDRINLEKTLPRIVADRVSRF